MPPPAREGVFGDSCIDVSFVADMRADRLVRHLPPCRPGRERSRHLPPGDERPGRMKTGHCRPVPGCRGEVVFPFAAFRQHGHVAGIPGACEARASIRGPAAEAPTPEHPLARAVGHASTRQATPELFPAGPDVPVASGVERRLRGIEPGRRRQLRKVLRDSARDSRKPGRVIPGAS